MQFMKETMGTCNKEYSQVTRVFFKMAMHNQFVFMFNKTHKIEIKFKYLMIFFGLISEGFKNINIHFRRILGFRQLKSSIPNAGNT